MKRLLCAIAFLAAYATGLGKAVVETGASLLVIQGAPGEASFAEGFNKATAAWLELGGTAGVDTSSVYRANGEIAPKEQILSWISDNSYESPVPVWLVYIGHGTFDGEDAKMNLAGPDLSLTELQTALEALSRPLVLIHGGSASGPFLPALSGSNRIVITATKSGNEQNYARFGEFFASAIANPQSDLDLDGAVSLLEAFLSASAQVDTFYLESGRLATEHALIDDNGDSLGVSAKSFQGLRPKASNSASNLPPDGLLARKVSLVQSSKESELSAADLRRRDELEADLETLRQQKSSLSEADYYDAIERIFLELSTIYIPENRPNESTMIEEGEESPSPMDTDRIQDLVPDS